MYTVSCYQACSLRAFKHQFGFNMLPRIMYLSIISRRIQLQIELGSAAPENMAEFKCAVTLRHNLLASEFTVINRRSSSLQLLGCVMNHLTVSTPDATYAVGLQGSNYHGRRPINTEFSIIPPDSDKKISSTSGGESWAQKAARGLFSSWETRDGMKDEAVEEDSMIEESEGEEADDYAHMTEEMCRTYTSAPREFTVIDRVMTSLKLSAES